MQPVNDFIDKIMIVMDKMDSSPALILLSALVLVGLALVLAIILAIKL